MRTLILTLTILDPHAVSGNKILLIKFIRGISGLGLYEAKTFVEQVIFADGIRSDIKINFKFPVSAQAMQTLCDFNSPNHQNRVPGVKFDVYVKPRIWDLSPDKYRPRPLPSVEGNEGF